MMVKSLQENGSLDDSSKVEYFISSRKPLVFLSGAAIRVLERQYLVGRACSCVDSVKDGWR